MVPRWIGLIGYQLNLAKMTKDPHYTNLYTDRFEIWNRTFKVTVEWDMVLSYFKASIRPITNMELTQSEIKLFVEQIINIVVMHPAFPGPKGWNSPSTVNKNWYDQVFHCHLPSWILPW